MSIRSRITTAVVAVALMAAGVFALIRPHLPRSDERSLVTAFVRALQAKDTAALRRLSPPEPGGTMERWLSLPPEFLDFDPARPSIRFRGATRELANYGVRSRASTPSCKIEIVLAVPRIGGRPDVRLAALEPDVFANGRVACARGAA
jgi:hypothetical protein